MVGEKYWNDDEYHNDAITGLKSYVIGEKIQSDKFANKKLEIISANRETSGKDRFYVMALEDLDECPYWYYEAWYEEEEAEQYESNFGIDEPKGMTNTKNNIEEWNKRNRWKICWKTK